MSSVSFGTYHHCLTHICRFRYGSADAKPARTDITLSGCASGLVRVSDTTGVVVVGGLEGLRGREPGGGGLRLSEGRDWTVAGALCVRTQPTPVSRGTSNTRGSLLSVCLCTSERGGGEGQVRAREQSRSTECDRDAHPGTATDVISDVIMLHVDVIKYHIRCFIILTSNTYINKQHINVSFTYS